MTIVPWVGPRRTYEIERVTIGGSAESMSAAVASIAVPVVVTRDNQEIRLEPLAGYSFRGVQNKRVARTVTRIQAELDGT